MYCTALCPYCVMAERLLRSKGVIEIEKRRVDLTRRPPESPVGKPAPDQSRISVTSPRLSRTNSLDWVASLPSTFFERNEQRT